MSEKLKNLIINGVSSFNGGNYEIITINGHGNVSGNLSCHSCFCNGKATVKGNFAANHTLSINGYSNIQGTVSAPDFEVSGYAKVSEDVTTKNLKVSGNTTFNQSLVTDKMKVEGRAVVGKDVHAKKIDISGRCKIGGDLDAEDLVIRGSIHIGGNCQAEKFHNEGQFKIKGLLNADEINIDLYGISSVKEIGGTRVTVKQNFDFISKLVNIVYPMQLKVEAIEADTIELIHTNAKTVRGKNITIGDNCQIDLLEYSGTFNQSKTAKISKAVKI